MRHMLTNKRNLHNNKINTEILNIITRAKNKNKKKNTEMKYNLHKWNSDIEWIPQMKSMNNLYSNMVK